MWIQNVLIIEIGANDDNEYVHVDYEIIIKYKLVHICQWKVGCVEVIGCDGDEGLLSAFSV